jgi:hypothetical protein
MKRRVELLEAIRMSECDVGEAGEDDVEENPLR